MAKRDVESMSRGELIAELRRLQTVLENDSALRDVIQQLESHREELHSSQLELSESRSFIERSRDAYAALFEFAPIGYLILEASGMVTDLNFTAANLLATERAHLIGYPFVTLVAPHDRRRCLDYLRRCRQMTRERSPSPASSGELEIELALKPRSGGLVPVLVTAKGIHRGAACLSEFHVAITDLTARRRLEEQTHRVEEERRQAEYRQEIARAESASKDHFIAVLSHELRTPLAPIRFAVASLRHGGALPDALRRALDIIDRNVEHEARMIEELLDVTRIAQGKLHLVAGPVDVHRLVDDVLATHAAEIERAALHVTTRLDATAFVVWGDEGRLRQVLVNLVRNACANTPAQGRLTITTDNPSPDRLSISIRDDGRGIDRAALSRLFQPFQQADARSPSTGLGLGLSICKGIVEAHEGRIAAASDGPGTGATFTVELPALAVERTSVPAAPPAPIASREPSQAADGVKVLLVEDNIDSAESMAALLEMFGYRVRVASSVQAALHAAEQHFDVLVSDIGLPDGTGRDLIRELSARRPVRGIALTGYGTPEDVLQNTSAGFARHLLKPVDPSKLVAAIDEVMRSHLADGTGGSARPPRRR